MGQNGDKVPYFWMNQFFREDGLATKVAESENMNKVGIQDNNY